jgi:pyruvate formate lyase activating enzyme
MFIAGLQKLTLIDYPDKVAAVVFTLGCNFYCSFCHNPELANYDANNANRCESMRIKEEDFFEFLKSRQGLLEGICITGGEPTLQGDLKEFITKIKELGFLVKLDTNGTNSKLLEDLICAKLIDYVAMDIKAPFERYAEITRRLVDLEEIKKSIKITMEAGFSAINSEKGLFDYEFRSTLVPGFHQVEDIKAMAGLIAGAKKYFLQNFISQGKILDSNWLNRRSFTEKEMKEFQAVAGKLVEKCEIRM